MCRDRVWNNLLPSKLYFYSRLEWLYFWHIFRGMNDYNKLAMLYRLDQIHPYTYKGTHRQSHIHNRLHTQTHTLKKVKLNIVPGGVHGVLDKQAGSQKCFPTPNARDLLNSDSPSRRDWNQTLENTRKQTDTHRSNLIHSNHQNSSRKNIITAVSCNRCVIKMYDTCLFLTRGLL